MSADSRDPLEPERAVAETARRAISLFPVRVWRRFLVRNGFLLSAGIACQALFAIFAAIYIVFATAGSLLAGDPDAVQSVIAAINSVVPGFIGDSGVISADAVTRVARGSASLFGWTGAIASAGFIWTAIGWMTYSRTGVRSMFGLEKDSRNYVLLTARTFSPR